MLTHTIPALALLIVSTLGPPPTPLPLPLHTLPQSAEVVVAVPSALVAIQEGERTLTGEFQLTRSLINQPGKPWCLPRYPRKPGCRPLPH